MFCCTLCLLVCVQVGYFLASSWPKFHALTWTAALNYCNIIGWPQPITTTIDERWWLSYWQWSMDGKGKKQKLEHKVEQVRSIHVVSAVQVSSHLRPRWFVALGSCRSNNDDHTIISSKVVKKKMNNSSNNNIITTNKTMNQSNGNIFKWVLWSLLLLFLWVDHQDGRTRCGRSLAQHDIAPIKFKSLSSSLAYAHIFPWALFCLPVFLSSSHAKQCLCVS